MQLDRIEEEIKKSRKPTWITWAILIVAFLTLVCATIPLFCSVPISLTTDKSKVAVVSKPSPSK